MDINGWMNKQNVIHMLNGILFSFKKEGNSYMCYIVDGLEDIMVSEISQTQKDKYCMIPPTYGT